MSINDLLKNQKCEMVRLEDVVDFNKYKQIGASELEQLKDENGDIQLLPSSNNYDWKTTEEKAKDLIQEGEVITLGRARYANLKYCKGKFVSSNNIIITTKDEKFLCEKYLYYIIKNNEKTFYVETSTYPKFDSDIFKEFCINLPPLSTQLKIVEVLDKFTSLEKELEKELEKRKLQYQYYRDKLLTFTDEEREKW